MIRPTSGDVQITISSAKRDRCTAAIEAAASVSSTKSRSETASSEFAIGRSKPSAFAVMSRSIGNDGAGERGGAERGFVQPLARVAQAAAVARRHLDIGEQMMAEGHRLRGLQMGEARHHGAGMLQRLLGERALVAAEQRRRVSSMASRTQSRKSVATWSLRERAVCSRPAAGPISSASRLSTFI